MDTFDIENIRISSERKLITPKSLKKDIPVSLDLKKKIFSWRKTIGDIIKRNDSRLMVIVGPCSVHDSEAALDYARRLKVLSDKLQDTIFIVMRVYFEKPRTTIGWKGLINDPYLDNSFDIEAGLKVSRKLLVDIGELGLPIATEALDPISPQYYHDLISWTAIGARTTESQTHREMASGLSSPVGFKNGTDGGLAGSINAIISCCKPHHFLGINELGQVTIIETTKNEDSHIVLRGGGNGPNFDSVNVSRCEKELLKHNIKPSIVIDCSHANAQGNYENQPLIADNITSQIIEGNSSICGIMLESNIKPGNQPIPSNLDEMEYGVSITDKCIGWEDTDACLQSMYRKLKYVLKGMPLKKDVIDEDTEMAFSSGQEFFENA